MAVSNFTFFMEYESKGKWQSCKHLELLCSKLQEVEQGITKRLIISLPPRHGKSECVSKKFPAWYLGKHPDKEIILASYAAELAEDHSKIARDTLKEWGYIFNVNVAKESSAVNRWGISKHRGGLTAAGVGGAITGRGADIAIIDDPFKNQDEADSEAHRKKVMSWYRTALRTRLAPNGSIIIVMTRWHEDDLVGNLLQEQLEDGEQWEYISFPACAETDDVLGRIPGEYLWTERFSPLEYEMTKKAVGTRAWNSLYQQKPSPDEGNIFLRQWFKYYTVLPRRFDTVIQSWDFAFKDLKTSDYVVGQVWGKYGADIYLIDQIRDRLDMPKSLKAVRDMSKAYPQAKIKLIEDKANGSGIIAMLKKEIQGIIAVNPQGGKIARAHAITPIVESGNVYLPHPTIKLWINDFVEEVVSFPNVKNDDQTDAMTQAISRINKRRNLGLQNKPAGW